MEKTKNNMIAPIVVLVAICLVASAMLAGIFQVASPIIEARSLEAAEAARAAVLPAGEGFTKWEGELADGINNAYVADNGAGMVCSTSFNGFNGAVELMIGLDADGKITGTQVMSQSETPGVGSNALTEEYRGRFIGKENADGIDAYSGATFTSRAVRNGINAAAAQYTIISNSETKTGETEADRISKALETVFEGGKNDRLSGITHISDVKAVYSNNAKDKYAMLVEKVGYNKEDFVRVIVGIDKDGAVTVVIPVYNKEVEGIGDTALADQKFLSQFAGVTAVGEFEQTPAANTADNTANTADNANNANAAGNDVQNSSKSIPVSKGSEAAAVDAVSNATETCRAVFSAVKTALEQYAAITK